MDQAQEILTNSNYYFGVFTAGLVVAVWYFSQAIRKIKPKPLKLAKQQCHQWAQMKYGRQKGWFNKFMADFEQFEIEMKYRHRFAADYDWRTLAQYLSPDNQLPNPDFLERVSIFMEQPMLVQGSIQANRL
jgi:hypothetical protein